jgi:pyrimidine oxygenase
MARVLPPCWAGRFIPIGNNGWLISTTSPQYMSSFALNREIVQKAERYGLDFALSMIKLRAGVGEIPDGHRWGCMDG